MKLTALERKRILAGEVLPLTRDAKPEVEKGDQVVVVYSRERRHMDPSDGFVFEAPEKPMVWITVTKVTRTVGGWSVRYDITDVREKALYLAPGSGYTSSSAGAIDRLEALVSDKDRAKIAAEARAAHAERQEAVLGERLKQERAFRTQLRERLDGLGPAAQQQLLAQLHRLLQVELEEAA